MAEFGENSFSISLSDVLSWWFLHFQILLVCIVKKIHLFDDILV